MIGLTATMAPGIAVGVVGLGMALSTYPIYNRVLKQEREKIAPEILHLSDELLK